MRAVSDAFAAAIREPHERIARVSILDASLGVVDELTGTDGVTVDGSVQMDSSKRRSCSLSIANPDGDWTPAGPADPLFPNGLIRLERGIVVDGSPELVSLGVFLIDRPVINVSRAGSTISISGQDRVKLALKSRFTRPVTFDAGTPLADVVQAIAQAAGMGDTLYRLDDGGKALVADRTFESDEDRWPALQQLAHDYALEAFVDADGYLVLAPAVTPATLPSPVWTFERGDEAIMLGLTKEWSDDRLYNHVRVSGEAASLAPVSAEARDLNPESPAYNPTDGTGPIGDRLFTYTSPMIRSVEQAQEVADALLLTVALVEEAITIPSVVHPALEVGDVVTVAEEISRTADTYLLDTVSIPLATGPMSVAARKLRSLTA